MVAVSSSPSCSKSSVCLELLPSPWWRLSASWWPDVSAVVSESAGKPYKFRYGGRLVSGIYLPSAVLPKLELTPTNIGTVTQTFEHAGVIRCNNFYCFVDVWNIYKLDDDDDDNNNNNNNTIMYYRSVLTRFTPTWHCKVRVSFLQYIYIYIFQRDTQCGFTK